MVFVWCPVWTLDSDWFRFHFCLNDCEFLCFLANHGSGCQAERWRYILQRVHFIYRTAFFMTCTQTLPSLNVYDCRLAWNERKNMIRLQPIDRFAFCILHERNHPMRKWLSRMSADIFQSAHKLCSHFYGTEWSSTLHKNRARNWFNYCTNWIQAGSYNNYRFVI